MAVSGYFDFSDTFTLVDNPVLRVSQVAVETLRRPTQRHAWLSASLPLKLRRAHQAAIFALSQLAVEVVRRNGSPPSSGQGGMLIVVAG
jgi:hypothetical protein